MGPVAIIGAGGFVGCRLVEKCTLNGIGDIFPVARSNRSLARLCRFGLNDRIRLADGESENSVLGAVKGCDVVVNLITGDPESIVRSTRAIHSACVKAGVRRLIHMSSAVVFGRVESPETGDDSPVITNHWMPYARAKAESEIFLRKVGGLSPPEITVLRPGIVWGPRSAWSTNAALALKSGTAYLVGDGSGVCNSIHVDNLAACILACCEHEADASGFFNVGDEELITWRDFYRSLADYMDYDISGIPMVRADRFTPSVSSLLSDLKSLPVYYKLKRRISPENRALIKKFIKDRLARFGKDEKIDEQPPAPCVTREMWNLQNTRHKLSNRKFSERFGYVSPVSFKEGAEMTQKWLGFVGIAPESR